MARQARHTLPQVTLLGKVSTYEELLPHLIKAEAKGRVWAYEQVSNPDRLNLFPTDLDVYELHKVMFADIFSWAGQVRLEDRGPAGICNVPWNQIRQELRIRFDNLAARAAGLDLENATDIELLNVAELTAQMHHDFQYVHPFADTNGRTGRVLDHYSVMGNLRTR